jgi:hypothetical protein
MLNEPSMIFHLKGIEKVPLSIFKINGKYIIAAYQGNISDFDILIKYRQKESIDGTEKWSRIRTPKHIHWTVDLLIKMNYDKAKTKKFIDSLISIWKSIKNDKSDKERIENLNEKVLLRIIEKESKDYVKLNKFGEYSIKFLILLARLLIKQEKNNRNDAYMFKKLLDNLKNYKSIYQIVSTATMGRR